MLRSHFPALAFLTFLSTTAALPTSAVVTELICQIAPSSLREKPVLSTLAVSLLEEIPSALDASSPVSSLYEFDDKEVMLENLAARSNGHLLLTATSHPKLYTFDPYRNIASLLYTFPESTSTLGIVEAAPDVFIVAAGNFTYFQSNAGSFSVWSVDLKNYHDLTDSHGKPIVKKITDIPQAEVLNGMTRNEGSSHLVLISDSVLGRIWRVDITSGKYSVAIENVLFNDFVNTAQQLYGRIAIDKTGGATGEPEIIAHSLPDVRWDDFAIDWEGNGWLATVPSAVTEVTLGGRQRNFTVAADAGYAIQRPRSLVFGRGSKRFEKMLFLVTGGGDTGARIFAVDTRLC